MASRRSRTFGLTDEDVRRLRDQLADGRRPRVRVSGPQFADGTSATVVTIGDPAVDGADYVTVRVKVNGVLDELAFAPAELSLGRTQPAGRAQPAGRPQPASPAAAKATKSDKATAAAKATTPGTAPDQPTPEKAPTPETMAPAAATAPQPTGPGRRRKTVPVPKVSFTVASSGASWAVSASRGAKGIVKNTAVQPGVVTALADLLGQPALLEAVAEINETARAEAQARAEQLRAELNRLEAVLATHQAPSGRPAGS